MTLPHFSIATCRVACLIIGLAAAPLAAYVPAALAQTAAATDDAKQRVIEEEAKTAFAAADKAKITGPSRVKLLEQGFLDLPDGRLFVPQPEASSVLRAMGNSASSSVVGLIFSGDKSGWWAVLNYLPSGYVRDEEAKEWNADELLANLQKGTEDGNSDRLQRGFKPIEVSGWIEKPLYNADKHRLVWSALVRDKGASGEEGSVNYNTYALGRDGYFSLNLITKADTVAQDKTAAAELLAGISYNAGKNYSDFNASTDHVAEYGIAALIGGIAAKKLGLLALGAAFFLKFAKLGLLALVAFGAGIAKFFRRKRPQA